MTDKTDLELATNAATTLMALYEWHDRVTANGGTTSISGIASAHAMHASMDKNRKRLFNLIVTPILERNKI